MPGRGRVYVFRRGSGFPLDGHLHYRASLHGYITQLF